MRGAARALVITVLVAGPVAGCGGGDKVKDTNRYISAINQSERRFADDVNNVSTRITSDTRPADEAKTLAGYARAVGTVTAALRSTHPPAKVRDLHQRLIDIATGFGREVEVARRELTTHSATKVLDAQERIPQATTTVFRQINGLLAQISRRLA